MKNPEELKSDFTQYCTVCGVCAGMCPALTAAGLDTDPIGLQQQVMEFLQGAQPEANVIKRAVFCNTCYQCTGKTCPVGLNPMRTNLLLRGLLREQGKWPGEDFIPPSDPAADELVMAGLLTTPEEFLRITTPFKKGDGRFLFFPGCNVYSMPDKLLTAMDIMDRLTENWSYLPGLSSCCGGNYSIAGDLAGELTEMNKLVKTFQTEGFEAIVLWCPTCVVLFNLSELDLPTISFARFVADRIADHKTATEGSSQVTLHDPCKNFFLGIDPEAPRELLNLVTGGPVVEMPRKSYCCGYGLLAGSPENGRLWIESRLKEASDTGAGTMVNICHGCHWFFTGPEWSPDIRIANYVTLVGQALGIVHEERFLKWRRWGDPERILNDIWADIGDRIDQLPWPNERIAAVIRKAFTPEAATEGSG